MKLVKALLILLYINTVFMAVVDGSIIFGMRGGDFNNENGFHILLIVFIAWIAAFLVIAILNLYQTAKLSVSNDAAELRRRMKLLKLGAVPYFVLNLILVGFFCLIVLGASRGLLIFLIPLPVFFTWIISLVTSVYGIGFIAVLKRSGRDSGTSLPMHMGMQFCLVLDVISTVILLRKTREI